MDFPSPLFLISNAYKKVKTVLILPDLDPIFKNYSKSTKVIDDSVRCYKGEALENPKKLSNKRNFFFHLSCSKHKLRGQDLIKFVQNFKENCTK